MKSKTISLTIYFFCFVFNIIAQEKLTFPIRLCNNRIIIDYLHKNDTIHLIFDSGSTANLIDYNSSELLNIKSFNQNNYIDYGINKLKTSIGETNDKVLFGKVWNVLDKNYYLKGICDFSGIVGVSNIFSKYVVEINFNDKEINFNTSKQIKPISNFTKKIKLNDPTIGNETSATSYIKGLYSVTGNIKTNDTTIDKVQFLIDTGSQFEIALILTDSSLIKKYSEGKKEYSSEFEGKKVVDYTTIKYCIDSTNYNFKSEVLMFYTKPSIFNIFGRSKVGVLLGTPYFSKYKSVIIDSFDRNLILYTYN